MRSPCPRNCLDSPCTCILTLTFPLPVWSMLSRRRCSGLPRKQSLENAPKGLAMLQNLGTPHSRSDFTQWFPPEQAARRPRSASRAKDSQLFSLHRPGDLSIPGHPAHREMAVSCRFCRFRVTSRVVLSLKTAPHAPVAQLDRASDYGSEG